MNPAPPVRIRLFGTPAIEREDGSALTGGPAQRHRVALLALLALAPSRRMSREKLMAWLWPEADAERARKLLNVSAYVLRSALGEGVLMSGTDELRLGEGVLADVAEFEAAVADGDYGRAAALYTRPFLDAFFLPDAEEFEEWSGRERRRLAALYGKCLAGIAEAAEAAGDRAAAVEHWRARTDLDPYDSQAALRLMHALAANGNRAAAIQHAAEHARRLREEVGVEAGEVVVEAERIRAEAANAEGRADASRTSTSSVATAFSDSPASLRRRSRLLPIAAATLVLALVAWLALGRGAPPERSIVVLPFANLSQPGGRDYVIDGLTDEIIAGLATVPGLTVIARTSALRYASSVTPIPEIARELNVANVLHGTLRREGSRARVTAQLVDARRERVLWARSYVSELDDTLGVQERIARDVVRALELRLGTEGDLSIIRRTTNSAEALEAYQRGRFHWGRRAESDVAAAIGYFERAIALDSGFADAFSGLADALLVQWQLGYVKTPEEEVRRRFTWAAERAISLDDESADAHTSFATALWWQKNWPGAEREFRRAIALNPNHAGALHWYSLLLAGFGRQDEALRLSRRSVELDPYALIIVLTYGWQCYLAHDWHCAAAQADRTLELNPEWAVADAMKARALAHLGRREEAMESARRALAQIQGGTMLAEIAWLHAVLGDRAAAREVLGRALAAPDANTLHLARAWTALGETDSAFAALERRRSWLWPHRATIYDPDLDPIRRDPRMEALRVRIETEMGVR